MLNKERDVQKLFEMLSEFKFIRIYSQCQNDMIFSSELS